MRDTQSTNGDEGQELGRPTNHDGLQVEWISIERVFGNPANPRINDAAVDPVAASLRRFGWRQPVVAKRSGEVIAGNTRLKAAAKLGMTVTTQRPCYGSPVPDPKSLIKARTMKVAFSFLSLVSFSSVATFGGGETLENSPMLRGIGGAALVQVSHQLVGAPQRPAESTWTIQVAQSIRQSEYFYSASPEDTYSAPNRSQNLRSQINARGISIIPREASAHEERNHWNLSLATESLARDGSTVDVGPPEIVASGARVELRYHAFTEWFVNYEEGIEQGWTLVSRPVGPSDNPLRVQLRVDGLRSCVADDGLSAEFVDSGDVVRIQYQGPRSWDVTGQELRTWIEPTAHGIAVCVIDDGALYPVTIDPVLTGPSWTAEPDQAEANMGISVAGAGDVNGDGYDDVIVGARLYDGTLHDEGAAFLYYGSPSGPSITENWTKLGGQAEGYLGWSVAGAGDVNDDGFDDVIIGHWYLTQGEDREGGAHVFLGAQNGLPQDPEWTGQGNQALAGFGVHVAGGGDVNGDGFDDVLVTADLYDDGFDSEGRCFLFFGSVSGPSNTPDWFVDGDGLGARLGAASCAGDVNGDGYDDILTGSWLYTGDQTEEGRARLYFGVPSPSLPSTSPGWQCEGNVSHGQFGATVDLEGDVDGDGLDDMLVGATGSEVSMIPGKAHMFLGAGPGPSTVPDWSAMTGQANDFFGWLSCAGDVNNDGYDDVVVGAPGYDNGQVDEGALFLYLGSENGLQSLPDWVAESEQADASLGRGIDAAGDVDGDSYDDVIAGAFRFDNGQLDEGRAFLFRGQPFTDCNDNGMHDPDDIAQGASQDCNSNGVPDECDIVSESSGDCDGNGIPDECDMAGGPGVRFCFGDGTGTSCPCLNAGGTGYGCANSAFGSGALLCAAGEASIAADTLVLAATCSRPAQSGLFFQGTIAVNGGSGFIFGDGLRCAGGSVVRLQIRTANFQGHAETTVTLSEQGEVSAGDLVRYQWWYRDPTGSPCGTGFNLSNGLELTWAP